MSTQTDDLLARVERAVEGVCRQYGVSVQPVCHDGTVELLGNVPSFYLKQLVQERLRQVRGVVRIDNRIGVRWDTD